MNRTDPKCLGCGIFVMPGVPGVNGVVYGPLRCSECMRGKEVRERAIVARSVIGIVREEGCNTKCVESDGQVESYGGVEYL